MLSKQFFCMYKCQSWCLYWGFPFLDTFLAKKAFFEHSKDSHFWLKLKIKLYKCMIFSTKDISSALFLLHSIVVFTFCRNTAPNRLSLRLSTMLVFSNFDSALLKPFFNKKSKRVFATIFLIFSMKTLLSPFQKENWSSKKLTVCTWHISGAD